MDDDEEYGIILADALIEWGGYDDFNHQLTTDKDDIKVWYIDGQIYDSFSQLATYKAVHRQIERVTILGNSHQPPMEEGRLEVLLTQLLRLYPDLWTRRDWSVEVINPRIH
jgi:hypothetical protein